MNCFNRCVYGLLFCLLFFTIVGYGQNEIPTKEKSARLLLPPIYNDYQPKTGAYYDFIIIGSGSSGAVLANRLSEIPDLSILLLEVGGYATELTDIPAIAPLFQFTDLNWNYLMEPQPNMSLGLVDGKMAWPRGRGLGGSTLINYMIYTRGNRYDYDKWAGQGNPGWSYNEVLPYFLKSEDIYVNQSDRGYHRNGGYLSVTDIPYRSRMVDVFIKACQEAGYKYIDYNGRDTLGVSYVQGTLRNGRRCSVEKAFLRTAQNRRNLKISTNSRAVQLLIDPKTRKCNGVKFVKNRQYYYAYAKKEVLLSAGAFNSPQLLILSGIGPKQHLADLGIPLIKDLPVGQKLYDHLCFLGLAFRVNQSIVSRQEDLQTVQAFVEFLFKGKGTLTSLGGVEALAYYKTPSSTETQPIPNIEYILVSGSFNTDYGQYYRKIFRVTDEIYQKVWQPLEKQSIFSIYPMLLHPKSYGYLRLKSTNPYHWPKFYGNYFTDPQNDDIRVFIEAIREVQRIINTPALRQLGVEQIETKTPGCERYVYDTDAYWECSLRHLSATLHHQISTCKMGPSTDQEAVVDANLRVHGIDGLRVIDTSVIPLTLSAHTNAPAIMIGEKAADIIKQDWNIK